MNDFYLFTHFNYTQVLKISFTSLETKRRDLIIPYKKLSDSIISNVVIVTTNIFFAHL